MIQNVLLTSLTPLKMKDEITCWENRPFTAVWPDSNQQKTRDIKRTIKKKQKRVRTAYSTEQLRALERTYTKRKYIDLATRAELAKTLNIGDKCIKIWFQNRRMKEKKESLESSCDSSSESNGNETSSVAGSPPIHSEFKLSNNNQFCYQNNSDYYQVNPCYETNQVPLGYGGVPSYNFPSYFYNDNNIYPTQYYPFEVNYSNSDGNTYNSCGNEMNNCWSSPYPYYAQM